MDAWSLLTWLVCLEFEDGTMHTWLMDTQHMEEFVLLAFFLFLFFFSFEQKNRRGGETFCCWPFAPEI